MPTELVRLDLTATMMRRRLTMSLFGQHFFCEDTSFLITGSKNGCGGWDFGFLVLGFWSLVSDFLFLVQVQGSRMQRFGSRVSTGGIWD